MDKQQSKQASSDVAQLMVEVKQLKALTSYLVSVTLLGQLKDSGYFSQFFDNGNLTSIGEAKVIQMFSQDSELIRISKLVRHVLETGDKKQ